MSEQIREQISAFLDGELPDSEMDLLLKRLTRDPELREGFGRYALIGEALRGAKNTHLTFGFAARINQAIDGEPSAAPAAAPEMRTLRWWRPVAGSAVAASVAAVAIFALQQRAHTPPAAAAVSIVRNPNAAVVAALPAVPKSGEAITYTVPSTAGQSPPTMLPGTRLTNYVFAHSKYSSPLGQRDVLTDLIVDVDQQPASPDASIAR